ncbi:hypothetical protein FGE12_04905 [Aggregicoccus sp. 17bor-14]|uniref:hypothetical protein n=1 Tax=Myxococcaceae TaxID=31 RepID=UPI00129C8081|nr:MULTISPECIES: hypothetical protein [Myxococcaceae]MBF5041719.1 hypothetical protein [Simulacricoccus sp. 17bor-14]MRI87500.1 hypothetical protein [Aggregicoccus sp. 17bor-14]
MKPLCRAPLPSALAAALTLWGGAAAAQTPAPTPDMGASAPPPQSTGSASLPTFGLMVDVGVPDGLGLAGVVRPLSWLRLNAGPVTNSVGFGVRGGLSIAPFHAFLTPSLNADVGHYFKADYSELPRRFGASSDTAAATLKDVGYTFATASVGLELGSQSGFSFFLRAGLSYWDFSPANAEPALRDAADDPTLTVAPVSLRMSSPSVKLGFTLFL